MKKQSGHVIYSPSDLIRYLASPFASWLDRYYLENPDAIAPDKQTEEEELLSRTGEEHEQSVLTGYKTSSSGVLEISKDDFDRCASLEEETGQDQIAKLISAKFKGHGLARLVGAILKAQGYTIYLSPAGPDSGIDILAGAGKLGFDKPSLCVQVKSGDTPVESRTLNELRGAMQSVNASEGLFVSWGGFKPTVYKQALPTFFSVRLWTQKELLENLFSSYDRLDDDLKAELPLKRIWTVATEEEE